uniref:Sorbitol dehydrogenase n=1 Tax=Clastoptera arizonana TaxID=38151 RepID=A0A1B6DZ22_9HEMI
MDFSGNNLAAVLHGVNDLRLDQTPIPEPKDGEVLLKISCVGICGSDYHYYTHGGCANTFLTKPTVLGHEGSGTVFKLGKNVNNLNIGDRVAIEPGVACSRCKFCRQGRYNLCIDVKYSGICPSNGSLTRYFAHAADFCFKVPDHVSMEEAAMVQPLSIGVHACKRAGIKLASTCLITGSGPIGLVTLLTAKAMGASKVLITDILENRLQIAKQCGADCTLLVKPDDDIKKLGKLVKEILGKEPEITIDCCGNQETISLCLEVTEIGGNFILVGLAATTVTVPLTSVLNKEIDIKGVQRIGYGDYPTAVSLIASGKVDVKPLITHNFNLENILDAFTLALGGIGNDVKIMIHCDK